MLAKFNFARSRAVGGLTFRGARRRTCTVTPRNVGRKTYITFLSAIASLEGRLADLAEDDLCGVPLALDWPWLAEALLCALLLKATDGRAGAAKDIWVSLLLVLVCDITSVTVLHTTSVYTSPIDW